MPDMIATDSKTIAVVGGGLGGALAAIMLQRRGFTVHLFEGRPDWRVDVSAAINEVHARSRHPARNTCVCCLLTLTATTAVLEAVGGWVVAG